MFFPKGRKPSLGRAWPACTAVAMIFLVTRVVGAAPLGLAEAEQLALQDEPGRAALIARADAVMYDVKHHGKGGFKIAPAISGEAA